MRSADARIVLAAILIAGARTAPAQTAAPPASVEPARLTAYHQSFRVLQVTQGTEKQVATVEDQVILTDSQVIRVQSVTDPGGVMLDSSAADRATLKPQWHRSYSRQRTLRLDFAAKRVTGSYAARGDSATAISESVNAGVFDASMLDLVIAALPLAEGYRGQVPVFLLEAGGEIPAEVAVTGSEVLGGRDAWAVDVTLKGKTAKYHVAKREPRVIRIVSTPTPGMEIRFVQ